MDENNQKPRADYQPSVEAGLRRLESEKLSFLGSGNLVSKFDPKDLEAYAHIDEDDEDEVGDVTTTYERTLQELPSSRLSDAMTLDRMHDSAAMTLNQIEAVKKDEPPAATESTKDSVELEPMTTAPSLPPVPAPKTHTEDALHIDEDDDDELTTTHNQDDLLSAGITFWPSRSAPTLEFAAIRNYESRDDAPSVAPFGKTAKTDISENEIQDLSSQQFMMLSPTHGDIAADASGEFSISGMHPALESASQLKTQDLAQVANEVFLETAATVDVGSVAERVREALAAQQTSQPVSRVIKQGSVKMSRPQPTEGLSAMERLKQQGIFDHLGAHSEVSNNIIDIQDLLPKSEVKSYTSIPEMSEDDEEIGDQTCKQEPEGVEEVRQMVMRAKANGANKAQKVEADNLTIPLRQPDFVQTAQTGEQDLDDRMTIPISIDSPEFAKVLEARPMPKARHRSPVEEPLRAPTQLIEPESKFNIILIWIVVIVILLVGACAILYMTGLAEKLPFWRGVAPVIDVEEDAPPAPPTLEEIRASIDSVSQKFVQTADFESWMEPWLETRINHQTSPESRLPYLDVAHTMFPQNPKHRQRLLEDYLASGQYQEVRRIYRDASEDVQNQPLIKDLFYQSFTNDPKFIPPPLTLDEDECDMISPLGGGSTLTFKMLKNDTPIGAFKPHQTRRQSNYRSEIAAWRLCELLACDFDVPWNRPVRIEYNFFHQLFNRAPEKKRNAYRQNLVDIIWAKEENSRFVYGTYKDWVPDFTRFPIELTSMWKPWLSQENFMETFKPLDEALSSLKRRQNTQILYPELLEQSQGLTTQQLAAQVSEVLVFDFLIGNWDRFSGVPQWWGVNCQFKDGRITSIDNGAAFPTYSNDNVHERFMMTERFNARFIQALRSLDKTKTFELLFPDPSEREIKSLEQFWSQREKVLKRVEDLSAKYGAEKVLSL